MNLSLLQRVSLGFGGGINSIKTDFFAFFLGFFYLTFLGLDPLLTGTALLIALICDAFFDPIIGILSDRIKSRFGRRHVFMFLSIIPSAFFYMMIFIPNPDWSENQIGLFFWLLTSVILTRFFVSIFDIPHRALFAELGRSYFNNAKVMSSREGYQWIIAAIHSLVVYTFLGYYEDDPDKWKYIGLFGAGLMIIFGFLSFFGSKILIPKLYSWSNKGANYINFSKIKSELSKEFQSKFSFFDSSDPIDIDIDYVFAVGGDGTILRSITYVKDSGVPVLGINAGRLGFLTSVQKENIGEAVKKIKDNKFSIIDRTLLEVKSNLASKFFSYALNEVTIQRKDTTSLLNISCSINGNYLTNYWSDGLIISSPTGSTGYSLSNGGSIVSPESNVILLNPIAPVSYTHLTLPTICSV